MKTKDFFRMEYAQILIYIVFLGLLEVLLFIFEVNPQGGCPYPAIYIESSIIFTYSASPYRTPS